MAKWSFSVHGVTRRIRCFVFCFGRIGWCWPQRLVFCFWPQRLVFLQAAEAGVGRRCWYLAMAAEAGVTARSSLLLQCQLTTYNEGKIYVRLFSSH